MIQLTRKTLPYADAEYKHKPLQASLNKATQTVSASNDYKPIPLVAMKWSYQRGPALPKILMLTIPGKGEPLIKNLNFFYCNGSLCVHTTILTYLRNRR